jgi:DNA repair protein RadB
MKVSSGSEVMDELLNGGFEPAVITTIFGGAASGKTNICLLFAASMKEKVIWVDTEGSFSVERFKQITDEERIHNITFLKPTSFTEQHDVISKLNKDFPSNVGAIIVDTATMLYRTELSVNDVREMNDKLVYQYRLLLEIARKKEIPVICTAQVYSDVTEKDKINVVGGTIVRNISQCLVELKKNNGLRTAIIKKHRSIEENKKIQFRIVQEGIKKEITQTENLPD